MTDEYVQAMCINLTDEQLRALLRDRAEARGEDIGGDVFRADRDRALAERDEARRERDALRIERDEQEEFIDALGNVCCGVAFTCGQYEEHNERVRTHAVCAYCLHEDPRTPEAMTAHARVCEKHPLSAALAERDVAQRGSASLRLELEAEREALRLMTETALAAQAREAQLRAALVLVDEAYKIAATIDRFFDHYRPIYDRIRTAAAVLTECRADSTALREFATKCIIIASSHSGRAGRSDEALVDAVLKGTT